MAENTVTLGHLREFDFNSNVWSLFKPRLENYFLANEIVQEEKKRAILLNTLSEESYQLVFNLCMPDNPESTSYVALIKIINEHFEAAQPIFASRYKFYSSRKHVGESPKEWCPRVRSLAAYCDFSNVELKTLLRDQFIVGYEKGSVQDRLFEEEKEVTLAEAVGIACSKMNRKFISSPATEENHQHHRQQHRHLDQEFQERSQ